LNRASQQADPTFGHAGKQIRLPTNVIQVDVCTIIFTKFDDYLVFILVSLNG
jgi:hypothetical protein